MRELFARLRDSFRRREIEAAFDEEMQMHLDALEARYRERGLSAADARAAAVREFGNATRAREDLRERAGFPTVDEFVRDVRHAWRGLSRRPVFSLGLVAVLAIGLGAASALTSLTRAILYAPFAVPSPEELFLVTDPEGSQPELVSCGTARRFDENLAGGQAAGFAGIARFTVQRDGRQAARTSGELVTGNFFDVLRLAPVAGRLLSTRDEAPGAPAVVVVSEAWAVAEYGSTAAAVGHEIWVNRQSVTIVGVLPATFPATTLGRRSDLWLPATLQKPLGHSGNASSISGDDRPNDPDWTREERVSWMNILARLPRATRGGGEAALEEAFRQQREQILPILDTPAEREELQRRRLRLIEAPGGFSSLRASFRPTGLLLGVLVGSVLILACANVSGLLLVRTLSRHRELGVRLALGSGRWRIGRLAVAEALLLCTGGAVAGWVLSLGLSPVLTSLLLPGQTLAESAFTAAQLIISGALVLVCAAMCGLGPALLIARLEPLTALAGHGGLRGAAGRIGRALVGAQLALAVVLVAVATTLGTEIARTLADDPGFARTSVLSAGFDPRSAGYVQKDYVSLVDRLDQAARAVPGVVDVGFSSSGILNGSISRSAVFFRDPQAQGNSEHFQTDVVRPGYFQVVGMTLLAGRDLSVDDRENTPRVAVVSAAFAREVFGDHDVIGQRFGHGPQASENDFTIVGVVADAKVNGIRTQSPAVFYLPAAQAASWRMGFLALRVQGAIPAVRQQVQAAFARLEPGIVFQNWKTLDERVVDDLGQSRAATKIATSFATVAILLAAAGVAASLGYLITLRQRELALRIAIGADPWMIRRAVLVDAAKLGATGAAVGLALVFLLPLIPVVASFLPARPDLLVGAIAAAVGIVAAVAAGWSPARRASRADLLLLLKLE
ncbi:MAG: ABC transporter permease [Opitutaceae bacterium]|nr:ABC transporter permease [Opitutaceae bacterium]